MPALRPVLSKVGDYPALLEACWQEHLAPRAADAPKVAFPPDGAEVEAPDGTLTVRVRDGVAPFLWMVNGTPVAFGQPGREAALPLGGQGFYRLSVIDAKGRSAAASITIR